MFHPKFDTRKFSGDLEKGLFERYFHNKLNKIANWIWNFYFKIILKKVLWLWNDNVLEVGTSNIFFLIKNKDGEGYFINILEEILTPPSDEMILHGVMRDSLLKLLKEKNRYLY